MLLRPVSHPSDETKNPQKQIELHPVSLKFSDNELEIAFSQSQSEKDHILQKTWFMPLSLLIVFVFSTVFQMPEAQQLSYLSVCILVFLWAILYLMPTPIYQHHRFLFHFVMRASRIVVFVLSIPKWIVPGENETFLLSLVHRSGITGLLWHGLGYRVRFYQYILLHGIQTAVVAFILSPYVCFHLLQHRPEAQNWIGFVWKKVNILLEIGEDSDSQQCDDNGVHKCSMMLYAAYGFYAFMLPTLLIWSIEIQSRYQFVEQKSREGKWKGYRLKSIWKPEVVLYSGKLLF